MSRLGDAWRRLTGGAPTVRSAPDRPPTSTDPKDVVTLDEVRDQVRLVVLPGFTERAEVAETVSDYFEGYAGPTSVAEIQPLVDAVWEQRLAEQATLTERGDYDRLREAFADLEARGFVARMDFTCCQTCGHAEIDDERKGDETRYVFFHAQDAEGLAHDDTNLFLAFGCFDNHPLVDRTLMEAARRRQDDSLREQVREQLVAAETEVGGEVAAALRNQGLIVEWAGTSASRPKVLVPSWHKPLPESGAR